MRVSVLTMALAAGAIYAQPSAATQTADAASEDAETSAATTIVCRRMPAPTGSRIGVRQICKTEQQWSLIDQEGREIAERAVRTRLNCGASFPCE